MLGFVVQLTIVTLGVSLVRRQGRWDGGTLAPADGAVAMGMLAHAFCGSAFDGAGSSACLLMCHEQAPPAAPTPRWASGSHGSSGARYVLSLDLGRNSQG